MLHWDQVRRDLGMAVLAVVVAAAVIGIPSIAHEFTTTTGKYVQCGHYETTVHGDEFCDRQEFQTFKYIGDKVGYAALFWTGVIVFGVAAIAIDSRYIRRSH